MTDPHAPFNPMRSDPGNARWCEEHDRWECVAAAKRGPVCHGARIAGTDKCRMHAGVSGAEAKARGEVRLALAEAFEQTPRRHPAEVLLDCVHTSDVLLQQARADAAGDSSAEMLEQLRTALDQAAKWAKATLDLDVASREQRAFDQVGAFYIEMFERVLRSPELGLTARQQATVPTLLVRELQTLPEIGGGQ